MYITRSDVGYVKNTGSKRDQEEGGGAGPSSYPRRDHDLSAYGLHLSVYSCPLSLWIAFGLNKNVLVTKEKYKESLCAHQQAIAYSR